MNAPGPRPSTGRPSSSGAALLALVVANTVPLVGVLFFGWSLFGVMMVYWVESGIIGLFNIPRILLAQGDPGAAGWRDKATGQPATNTLPQRIGTTLFFLLHYGGFWAGHFFLLLTVLGDTVTEADPALPSQQAVLGFYLTVATLVLSHGLSFAFNYLGRGEYRTALPAGQMWAPYGRVIAFQVAALGGGLLAERWGSPVWALVVLVVLKTAVDIATHLVAHAMAEARTSAEGEPPLLTT